MVEIVFTMIPGLLGLLLSRAGKSDQRSRSLDCHPLLSRESAVDSCGADTLGECASVFRLRVWWWPMGSVKDRYLRGLLLSSLCWAPVEGNRAWLPTRLCSFGWLPEYCSGTWFHERLRPRGPWICLFGRWSPLAEDERQVTFGPWGLAHGGSRWRQQESALLQLILGACLPDLLG